MPRVQWEKGGSAEVLSLSDDTVTLRSTIPSPPGSRISGAAFVGDENVGSLWVKIHGSKRTPEGLFVLNGRPLDLGRELRERLCTDITAGTDEKKTP